MFRSILVALSIATILRVVSALSSDKLSLLDFKAKIEDDPLGLLGSWNESVRFCSWPGVTCSARHRDRVAAVDLRSWRLKGQLSPHIGNLSFLRELILSNNSFGSEIPREIGRLFRLRVLYLRDNVFTGQIPRNISGCLSLKTLSLYSNKLAGEIPAELGSLPELRILDLGVNELVGEIPFSLGNLSRLEGLSLRNNTLTGTIPASLGGLRNLKIFAVGMNSLEGTIPLSLYNVSTLEHFSVHTNKLEGSLPQDLGNTLPYLNFFYFHINKFSGIIPATMSNASKLVRFDISMNNFTGKVPIFKSSSNLQWLVMAQNNLGYAEAGDLDFIRDLFNKTYLENLGINENNFGGAIPETVGSATSTRLQYMTFGRNRIAGNIPLGIENLVSLEVLALEHNLLTGRIPSALGKLRMVNILSLESNKLSGEIPTTLGNLSLLSRLSLARNNLRGNIPTSLGECTNLQLLLLAGNNLSGPIPSQVISLSSLSITLDLSGNQLTGSIPLEVGKLANLGLLDFSENKLSGEIPETLGRCASLEFLYFQGNNLRGSIPKGLNTLKGVREIDLSRNDLSGRVPIYFADFRGLSYLNLSFNRLEGQVPLGGIFENASEFSVAGNTGLCGGLPQLKLPNCASKNLNENRKMTRKTKLFVIVSCVVVASSVVLILVVLAFLRRKRRKPPMSEPSVEIPLPRISYADLVQATDGFSSSNLIGVGGFGSVYKGILGQENKLVAIKVLNLHVSRALKSFAAECESLGNVRHRNLVKLQTVCSSIDFQGNDFKAIVYEYIENGNLEEWLHSGQRGQEQSHRHRHRRLSLIQRINIAIDVASALDYLHNHCSESIAHCDIKPINILLDGDMVAHLGDFGLAKLLRNTFSSTSNQTSSVGVIRGTIGYVPPEYATGSEVSTSGDIYSYGILLLEMFTGKRPTDSMFKDDFDLNKFASTALPNHITTIVDPLLHEEQDQDETVFKSLVSIIEIGVECSSKYSIERRNISDVIAELRKMKDALACKMP